MDSLHAMTSKRKPLEPWQIEDAQRLRALWDERHGKISQAAFASSYKIGDTQGIVWQYLSGTIPLNLKVAIKFAAGLHCEIFEFSPTLSRELMPEPATASVPNCLRNDALLSQLIALYAGLSNKSRDYIVCQANALYTKEHPEKSRANPYASALPRDDYRRN